jgi:hypothetical protein
MKKTTKVYKLPSISVAFLLLLSISGYSQDSLSYIDLINRVNDMEYLATKPKEGEKSATFTSYDRSSRYDSENLKYIDWDANRDGLGYIRKEGNDLVVFEDDGPGVIWRFWSALAEEGHIKIFIDDNEKPVVDKPFRDFFQTISNDVPPMNFTNLVMTLSRGRNHFIPISYNKHCKIVLSPNWGAYYHITYSNFPNTIIESYTGEYSQEETIELANTDRDLSRRGYVRKEYDKEKSDKIEVKVEGGSESIVAELKGNKAISYFRFEPKSEFLEVDPDILKDLWLSISWDNEDTPSVLVPIGLFFSSYPDVYQYRSLPLGIIGNAFYSNWWMPFSKNAVVKLINKGKKDFEMTCTIVSHPLERSADELLRFHAKNFNDDSFESDKKVEGKDIDWTFFKTTGQGRFCGASFHVDNTWEEPEKKAETWWYGAWAKKTIDWWWGEGDEKFYVDGEKFPSTFGTGSEDYIGYAWSAEPPFPTFDSPFASQPYTAIDGNGHTIVNRFQIADNVPFQKSFEACLERYKKGKWGENGYCSIDATVYWYQE